MSVSILALDSATPPSPDQARYAKADGYGAWLGYLPPSPGWHSAAWPLSAFDAVRSAGLLTAGIVFGPDAAHAASWARAAHVDLVIIDVEAGDAGQYVVSWSQAIRAAGLRAGVYGLRRTIAAFGPFVHVLWYAAERWDGIPNDGAQHGYNVTVCGVAVDVSTFGDAALAPPAPTPAPAPPAPPEVTDMYLIQNGTRISLVAGLYRRGLETQAEVDSYVTLVGPPRQVSQPIYDGFKVAPNEPA